MQNFGPESYIKGPKQERNKRAKTKTWRNRERQPRDCRIIANRRGGSVFHIFQLNVTSATAHQAKASLIVAEQITVKSVIFGLYKPGILSPIFPAAFTGWVIRIRLGLGFGLSRT
jgi:hypothetical protein